MKLSIIVPVYNMASGGKLAFCLDSLIDQTIGDYEIVAVDDCSTDDSLSVLREYEKKYPEKVVVIESEQNGRQGTAKNKGLNAARGEWVGFMDSDDWAAPDMYEKLIKRAEETGADVVGCDFSFVHKHSFEVGEIIPNSRDDQVGVLNNARIKSLILDGGSLCVKIFKRDRIMNEKLFFPEGIFYEDNAIGNSYLVTASHFEYVKEPLYYYYQHDTSTVHTITKERCADRMEAALFMLRDAKERGYYDEFKEEIDFKFIMLYYLNTVFSYVRESRRVDRKFVRSIAEGLKRELPDFKDNKYYKTRIDAEEQKYTDMHLKSPGRFILQYRLLWFYRRLRSNK